MCMCARAVHVQFGMGAKQAGFHLGGALSVVLLVATLLLLWAAAAIDPTRRRT